MKKSILCLLLIVSAFNAFAQDEKVNFSKKYRQQNNGKYQVEINEVKELIQIMTAITKNGQDNDDMIQQQGQYYKDVRAYFKPFENEPIIHTFDSLMNVSPFNFIFLTGNGFSYNFKGDKLVPSETFLFPAKSLNKITITENPITTYKKEIEAFAKKSQFRKFYKQQKPYYTSIQRKYAQNANLGKQWKWLEQNFQNRINQYIIFCSPLTNSLNYTSTFKQDDYKVIYMVLPPLDSFPTMSKMQLEIFNTRVMFTEIDHNYVTPPTQANKATINELFKERAAWVDEKTEGTFAYPTPVKVFDEYMTYGVFVLYVQDHYDAATFEEAKNGIISVMKDRGFIGMQVFTDNLLKARAANPGKTIDEWYPAFLQLFAK
ncbi:uncharacterized protein DUF4932 [Chitinophaga skermanii]|uniref:Uncharacterized protein DUF4932 n=1 Tax=Chitinophaga skermanii TaxID=331697 RepID=A0A327QN66_9BACT|nr:DUF4932 domain-containing protein [Chitinophaga skermanii]RAJ05092.1 uncharacterized protein DUF4932 [Chitinophaga skermanii]